VDPVPPEPYVVAVAVRDTFSLGNALARAGSVWIRNVHIFVPISLVANVPILLGFAAPFSLNTFGLFFAGGLATWLLSMLVTGTVTFGVVEQLRGRRIRLGKMLAAGMSRIWKLLWLTFATGTVVGSAALACLVPGVILWMRWLLVPSLVVVENCGVETAWTRSSELTRGYRWHLFGALLLGLGASMALSQMVSVVAGSLMDMNDIGRGLQQGAVDRPRLALLMLVTSVLPQALYSSFWSVFIAVAYYLLRSEKEGVDLEQLAAVFS
jgi:hypothetical protein